MLVLIFEDSRSCPGYTLDTAPIRPAFTVGVRLLLSSPAHTLPELKGHNSRVQKQYGHRRSLSASAPPIFVQKAYNVPRESSGETVSSSRNRPSLFPNH